MKKRTPRRFWIPAVSVPACARAIWRVSHSGFECRVCFYSKCANAVSNRGPPMSDEENLTTMVFMSGEKTPSVNLELFPPQAFLP